MKPVSFHTAVNCGDPGQPAHSTKTGSTYTYQLTVSYTCDSGYTHTSGRLQRICQANGDWSGDDIVCSGMIQLLCQMHIREYRNIH